MSNEQKIIQRMKEINEQQWAMEMHGELPESSIAVLEALDEEYSALYVQLQSERGKGVAE